MNHFESDENEFNNCKKNFNSLIEQIHNPSTSKDDRKRKISDANELIEEMQEVLSSMKLFSNSGNNKQLVSKCGDYDKEFKEMKLKFKYLNQSNGEKEDRDALLSGGHKSNKNESEKKVENRERMIQDAQKSKDTSAMIKNIKAELGETEQVAIGSIEKLGEQNRTREHEEQSERHQF